MKNLGKIRKFWIVGILYFLCLPVFAGGRGPANYFASDDFEVAPVAYKTEVQKVWVKFTEVDDQDGILNEMRNTFRNWEHQENYARLWNLRGIKVSQKDKTKYLAKYYFKYLDRRISEESKKSKAGSTVRKLASAKQTLNPKIKIHFSDKVRLRFKGRPLQGYGMMYLQNPWVDLKLQAEITGNTYVEGAKHIDELDMDSRVNYDIFGKTITAEIKREIIPKMEANIIYENDFEERNNDVQIQLNYSLAF
jgi:hypothetical protein